MAVRLVISETEYVLEQAQGGSWGGVAALPGGADAILGSSRAVDESRLEAAIEMAEDWLMPHAPGLRGQALEVHDRTGRVKSGMEQVLSVSTSQWTVDEVERFFLRLVDMATGRHPSPLLDGRYRFVADMLMLRELAHHGQVSEIHRV